jgi:hypothetical protein
MLIQAINIGNSAQRAVWGGDLLRALNLRYNGDFLYAIFTDTFW